MVTNKVYSHYKILGGFGLMLVLNIVTWFGTYKLLNNTAINFSITNLLNDSENRIGYLGMFGLDLLFLFLLVTQCRFIIADNNKITFINPLLPFLRHTEKWNYFDYYILVDETSKNTTHEAVWLVKNGRIKGRFSSFYYTNYNDLVSQVNVRGYGKKHFSSIAQLFILMGLKKIK